MNHPNILTVYDIGEADGALYIAMELVEGKTLRELLASGEPLPTKRLLDLAVQIAEGLAKAHAAGIVHRDLKPENVMVSKDGYVKILDFGLAKLTETPAQDASVLPTAIAAPTEPGTVMGTAGYMSPEQASGQPVDYRSDQFSLGAILYEMATGKRAFQRKTGAETLVAIIREEPEPLSQAAPKAPAPVRWIVERLLAKDPERPLRLDPGSRPRPREHPRSPHRDVRLRCDRTGRARPDPPTRLAFPRRARLPRRRGSGRPGRDETGSFRSPLPHFQRLTYRPRNDPVLPLRSRREVGPLRSDLGRRPGRDLLDSAREPRVEVIRSSAGESAFGLPRRGARDLARLAICHRLGRDRHAGARSDFRGRPARAHGVRRRRRLVSGRAAAGRDPSGR